MADRILHSNIDVEVRSIDEDKREATFIASTENPVATWGDPEVLRMVGVDLSRYNKNPVLLDTHARHGLASVIGSCLVKVEGRQLIATARYAKTKTGDEAWALVRDKHVRAMSIGYVVDPSSVTHLREGQREGDVEGPATIVNKWKLLEISNVPVPADEDAVRRSFYDTITKEAPVAEVAGSLIARAMEPQVPAPQVQTVNVVPTPQVPAARDYTAREILKRDVLAITPKGLEPLAEDCLLRGMDLEATRQALIVAQAKRFKPVGTVEPEVEAAPKPESNRALPDWLTDDVLLRSLENLGR